MKLLITTQKVDKDDPILGFFHAWIIEFAKHFDFVTVICLKEGIHDLPGNVKVLSLGKEDGESRKKYILRFYKYILQERKNYDVVFVHMNQVYIALGGILWKMMGKKIGLFYTHRAVSNSLKVAVLLSNVIFTAAKESFNIKTKKLQIIGHGIDIKKFAKFGRIPHSIFTILSVGRITRIKNLETLIEAAAILKSQNLGFLYEIIGPKVTQDDFFYFEELQEMVRKNDLERNIVFRDAVPNDKIGEFYSRSNLNVNLTPTGGIDKVVLEGIASGVIPLVSNKAFIPVFGPYADKLIFNLRDPEDLAHKIKSFHAHRGVDLMKEVLLRKIEVDFSLEGVVEKITDTMIR